MNIRYFSKNRAVNSQHIKEAHICTCCYHGFYILLAGQSGAETLRDVKRISGSYFIEHLWLFNDHGLFIATLTSISSLPPFCVCLFNLHFQTKGNYIWVKTELYYIALLLWPFQSTLQMPLKLQSNLSVTVSNLDKCIKTGSSNG